MPRYSLRSGRSVRQAGTILLGVSLIVFICSMAVAAVIWWQLRGQQLVAGLTTSSPLPAEQTDVLSPAVTVDPKLEGERANLQTNLVEPLRNYYATKRERLTTITIEALPEDEEKSYRAKVWLNTLSPTGEEQRLSFPYDLSPWNPSMLDNE